jgi:hypothetical protein
MMTPDEAQQFFSDGAHRARQLSRFSKRELAAVYTLNHPGGWTAHPVMAWSRDELINDAFRVDFPADTEIEAAHILYHEPGTVWEACPICTAGQPDPVDALAAAYAPAMERLAVELADRVITVCAELAGPAEASR